MAEFASFITRAAGSPASAALECVKILTEAGFKRIKEDEPWEVVKEGKYFFTRNQNSVFAFSVGGQYEPGNGFTIVGAHLDSPALQLKPISAMQASGFLQIGCETYGGGIWQTWFDRDLGISGKVLVQQKDGTVESRVVTIKKPLFTIPNLSIHFHDDRFENFKVNAETQLRAIMCRSAETAVNVQCGTGKKHHPALIAYIAQELKCEPSEIIGLELRLCDAQPASVSGINGEFVNGQGIDNLNGSYCGLMGLVNSNKTLNTEKNIRLLALFDHEEVGSASTTGGDSPIIAQTIERISTALRHQHKCAMWKEWHEKTAGLPSEKKEEMRKLLHEKEGMGHRFKCGGQGVDIALRKSFCLSVDNAHGLHPNYTQKHEQNHGPILNQGPVIKFNSKQRYATDLEGAYVIQYLSKKHSIPIQEFCIRQDSACGSTIGPITASNTGIRTADIGNPQFAMHSIREMCGAQDVTHMTNIITAYYQEFASMPFPKESN